MSDFWTAKSQEAIALVVGNLAAKNEEERRLLRIKIDSAYPFCIKSGYPYLAWMHEKRKAFVRYELGNVGFITGTRIITQKDSFGYRGV
ncbi:hypothetical protein H6G36_25415 [Anabaena minutissima FACHB-250]|nr:hypothetical protein [Anabaena minutissima FACHB-250]